MTKKISIVLTLALTLVVSVKLHLGPFEMNVEEVNCTQESRNN